jgi:hypothetical protein
MNDYLFDKSGDDPDVRALEALLGDFAHRGELRAPLRSRWRRPVGLAAVGVAAALIAIVVWRARAGDACAEGGAGLAFAIRGGAARCEGAVAARGRLPVGGWLETSGAAQAEVQVAEIGRLTVFGDSRVRLVATGADGHRLELARGKLAARVVARPRLFVVDTPVASAVDLGCAYELSVEPDGRTRLRVTSGAVSLEGHGRVAYATLDTEVIADRGQGPGTPVALAATAALRAAVARFDAGDAGDASAVIAAAGARDSITLWNLLSRTTGPARAAVAARLEAVAARPADVDAEAVIAGDPAAIERWRQALDVTWSCAGCGGAPTKR